MGDVRCRNCKAGEPRIEVLKGDEIHVTCVICGHDDYYQLAKPHPVVTPFIAPLNRGSLDDMYRGVVKSVRRIIEITDNAGNLDNVEKQIVQRLHLTRLSNCFLCFEKDLKENQIIDDGLTSLTLIRE